MKLFNVFASGAIALTTLASSAFAQFGEVPAYVRVRSINYAGSGCPAGSVAQNVSQDLRAFTLLFDSYIAQIGPGLPPADSRKNCAINVDLQFPAGWTFSLITFDYRGYVSLDRGVQGSATSRYNFAGDLRNSVTFSSPFRGPLALDYTYRDAVNVEAWSPCGGGRSLTINTSVALNNAGNRNGQGLLTVDTIEGEVKHTYGIVWRRC